MAVRHLKKGIQDTSPGRPPSVLRKVADPMALVPGTAPEARVRPRIHLTRAEHQFLLQEAARRGEPMAGVIRDGIDQKTKLRGSAWVDIPMLAHTPRDRDLQLPEDAAIHHDHELYGAPGQVPSLLQCRFVRRHPPAGNPARGGARRTLPPVRPP